MSDLLTEAIATRNFLRCLRTSGIAVADVEKAAKEHKLEAEFDRDKELAEKLQITSEILEDAGSRYGETIKTDECGTVLKLKPTKGGGAIPIQICSPIIIEGVGYNQEHSNPILFLKILTESGKWVVFQLPRSSLVSNGAFAAMIKSVGIRTADPGALCNLLSVVEPKNVLKTYESAGWHGNDFVLPNGEVIARDDDAITRLPAFDVDPRWGTSGDVALADEMLKSVANDPFIVAMVGTVLAAPTIKFFRDIAEPGIYHYIGASTTGKTTALAVAMSLQGKGCPQKTHASTDQADGIILSWNTTAYALQEQMAMRRDLALGLDEFSMIASAKDAQVLSYSTSNGATKAAGAGYTGFRKAKMLRSPIISTGEEGFAEKIGRDKNLKHNAGAAVRTLDVNFVSQGDAARADKLKKVAAENYGWHLRKLVRLLVRNREACLKRIEVLRHDALRQESNAQVNRVRARMSLLAAVIEFAIEKDVLPWPEGTGRTAVQKVLDVWKADFANGDLSYEVSTALKNFADSMSRHKDRIAYLNVRNIAPHNCLAKWKDGKLYFTESQLAEALGGAPIKPFLKHLASGDCADWGLERGEENRLNVKATKEIGTGRVYCIVDKHRAVQEETVEQPHQSNAENVVPMTRRAR